MSFLKTLFGKKETPINNYQDFWKWFQANAAPFYEVVKSRRNPEKEFFEPLSGSLKSLKEGFGFLVGMHGDDCAELIFTANGIVKHMPFVEDLVAAAPAIPNWKFTALNPAQDISNTNIQMGSYTYNADKLSFYAADVDQYPDQVDIVIVYQDYHEADKDAIASGVFIFLDNFLGELDSATTIDGVTICAPAQAKKDLIPIAKLKDYLIWREKEFVEKYNSIRHDSENDQYSALEATLENGWPLIAIMNTTLLAWDGKASHPWMVRVNITYDGQQRNGMPDQPTSELMNTFEDELIAQLKDSEGYLNIGRQTAGNRRDIFLACHDFREPSKLVHELKKKYAGKLDADCEIFRDKYWQSLEMFRPR